jgi:hypothetical protein
MKYILILVNLLALSLAIVSEQRVARFDTSGRSLVAAVVDLAFRYQLPTAIEYADRDATTRSLNLQFRDESVREILSRSLSMRSNSFLTES